MSRPKTTKAKTHKDTCVVLGPGTKRTIFGGRIRTGTLFGPKGKEAKK